MGKLFPFFVIVHDAGEGQTVHTFMQGANAVGKLSWKHGNYSVR